MRVHLPNLGDGTVVFFLVTSLVVPCIPDLSSIPEKFRIRTEERDSEGYPHTLFTLYCRLYQDRDVIL